MAHLFTSKKVGAYSLSHRVVLAPMTRLRTIQPGDIPSPMMADFYGQRASEGGLEIIEGVSISVVARSYLGAASFYHDGQVDGWKAIANAVHAKGGVVFMQLIHGGRQSHVEMTGGVDPVAPSVVPFEGVALTKDGFVPASPHRALDIEEIPGIIEEFRVAAQRAKDAGFDGVELHGANGYLVDQFIQDGTNKRTDAYGGPIENRVRFLREAVEALISVWGATGSVFGFRHPASGAVSLTAIPKLLLATWPAYWMTTRSPICTLSNRVLRVTTHFTKTMRQSRSSICVHISRVQSSPPAALTVIARKLS